MATEKPRFTITLDPEMYDLLNKYSSALGITKAKIFNDMLLNSKDSILALIALADKMKDAPKEVQLALIDKLAAQESKLNKALDDASQLNLGDDL
jgi:hypothetical protein